MAMFNSVNILSKMFYLQRITNYSNKSVIVPGTLRYSFALVHSAQTENSELNNSGNNDGIVKMENPYEEQKPKCILCEHNIEPYYKNVRLLSQFISKHTGRVYGKHITGLCQYQQERVIQEINKARKAGLMPKKLVNPIFFSDPMLYNESQPKRPHNYI